MTGARASVALLMMLTGACRGSGPRASTATPSPQRDVITRSELLNSAQSELDLYQAIRSLRPHFLLPPPGVRPAAEASTIVVYVDGIRQAGVATLRSIGSYRVEEVRYLGPNESRNALGAAASGGAVMVKLHKGEAEPDSHDSASSE